MTLVYMGLSLPNRVNNPLMDKVAFCNNPVLNSVKVSHDEYARLLDAIKNIYYVNELTLISTCNRFELILFLSLISDLLLV